MDLVDGIGTRGAPTASGAGDGLRGAGGVAGDPHAVVRVALEQANSAVDRLIDAVAQLGAHPEALDAATLERFVQDVQRLVNRHDRVRVRALDVVRRTREAGHAHHDDDAQYTSGRTRTDTRRTHHDSTLARALGNQPPPPPPAAGLPGGAGGGAGSGLGDDAGAAPQLGDGAGAGSAQSPTAQAWDDGLINREQALIITRALDDLPDHLSTEQRLAVETGLVAKAQRMSLTRLRKAAQRALGELDLPQEQVDAHHNELVRNEENAAWEAANFWITDRGDGTMYGQFTLPVLQGRMLEKALHALTHPAGSPTRSAHGPRGPASRAPRGRTPRSTGPTSAARRWPSSSTTSPPTSSAPRSTPFCWSPPTCRPSAGRPTGPASPTPGTPSPQSRSVTWPRTPGSSPS